MQFPLSHANARTGSLHTPPRAAAITWARLHDSAGNDRRHFPRFFHRPALSSRAQPRDLLFSPALSSPPKHPAFARARASAFAPLFPPPRVVIPSAAEGPAFPPTRCQPHRSSPPSLALGSRHLPRFFHRPALSSRAKPRDLLFSLARSSPPKQPRSLAHGSRAPTLPYLAAHSSFSCSPQVPSGASKRPARRILQELRTSILQEVGASAPTQAHAKNGLQSPC